MSSRTPAGPDDGPLLHCTGCFRPNRAASWIIGELSLSVGGLAFSQQGRNLFALPSAKITAIDVEKRRFILLRKDVIRLTYPTAGGREGRVWFITADLHAWLDGIQRVSGVTVVGDGAKRPASRGPRRWMTDGPDAQPVCLREAQLKTLAATVGAAGARVLWHLWGQRHAGIEELASLVDVSSHMELLTLLRDGINGPAIRLFGGPALAFRERGIDPDTGRTICFEWWLERFEEGFAPEVHDEGDALLVVAVVSGARPDTLRVAVRGGELGIQVETNDAPCELVASLPCLVAPEPTRVSFSNDVLSVWLAKRGASQ